MYDWPSFIPLPAKPEGLRDGDAHVVGDLVMCLYIFVALAIVDKVVFKLLNYFPTDGNGRYFSLHVLINAYVTAVHAKDVYATYTDPHNSGWQPCDNRGIVAIAALHIYHCVAYQPLAMVDIVHHVTMIGLVLPTAYGLQPGPVLGEGAFWASGLPGGIDYLLLVLVKLGYMKSLTEKAYNVRLQTWLRAPGCLAHSFVTWAAFMRILDMPYSPDKPRLPYTLFPDHLFPIGLSMLFTITLFFWNGLFFQSRVVASHATHLERQRHPKSQ